MTPRIEETIYLDFITSNLTTWAAVDADSTPTCEVFEDATDTAILTPTVVKRTSKTGNYRVPIACTAANGFEVGKSYNVVASATVGGAVTKIRIDAFQVREAAIPANVTKVNGSAVTSVGAVDANVTKVNGSTVTLVGAVDANVTKVGGTNIPTPAVAGVPKVDVAYVVGGAATAETGAIDSNVIKINGIAVVAETGAIQANLIQINGAAFASADLLASIELSGTVSDTTPAAGNFDGSSGLSAVDSFYVGSVIGFTGGTLKGLARRITSYTGSTRNLAFAAAFPLAPTNGDTFVIFGRID